MSDKDNMPEFPGEWRKRESMPRGLNDAGHLNNIAYFSCGEWHRGMTGENVQHWVRVDSEREGGLSNE